MKLVVGTGWVHWFDLVGGVYRFRSENITVYATGVAFTRADSGYVEWWPNEQIRKVEFDVVEMQAVTVTP